jgi:16S rRNA (uracil1498-N3)-methyltransferase
MQLFFGKISDNIALLHPDEARHASKVLRKKLGDFINVLNNSGKLFNCQIIEIHKDKLAAKVFSVDENFGPVRYDLSVAIAPTKNIDRFEWFLEKATEMGITAIYPIITSNSERKVIKHDRLERVLEAATKQSLKGKVPVLHPLQNFKQLVAQNFVGEKYIAHCGNCEKENFLAAANPAKSTLVCIGPEGDFNNVEIELAAKNGFINISLGESRLRTETAGMVAVAAMYAKVS